MKKAYLCVAILLMVVVVETAILTMNVASEQSPVTETEHTLDKLPETKEEYFSDLESLGCELIQITNNGKSGDFSVFKYESFRSIAFESKVVFFYASSESPKIDFFTIFEGQSFRMSVTYEEQ
jgi:hypothetical protein